LTNSDYFARVCLSLKNKQGKKMSENLNQPTPDQQRQINAADQIEEATQAARQAEVSYDAQDGVIAVTDRIDRTVGAETEDSMVIDGSHFASDDSKAEVAIRNNTDQVDRTAYTVGVAVKHENDQGTELRTVTGPAEAQAVRVDRDGNAVYKTTFSPQRASRVAEIVAGRANRDIVAKAAGRAARLADENKSEAA
jgi:hypothetical protein